MAEVTLEFLGEQVIALREGQAAQHEMLQTVIRMLRRLEDRIDRGEERQLSLMQSDMDLDHRVRALERSRD